MANSSLIITYLGSGLYSAIPSSPAVGTGVLALYYGTDTLDLYAWNGSSWVSVSGSGSGSVTSVATGTGLTGGPITTSGTISLASIANLDLLANISGAAAAPIPNTLTAILDAVFSSTQGVLLYRGASTWGALATGTSGQALLTGGASANPSWGTPTLASIAALTLLANATGSSATPTATTFSAFLDAAAGSTQGAILYRNASVWTVLAPGTSGQVLTTGGSSANPSWAAAGGTGTVTNVATGTGLTGGPITTTGTLSLATIATGDVLANISGSTAAPTATTVPALLDAALGSTQGNILYRGASTWGVLAPGTSGQVLTTGGSSANPSWATGVSGGGLFSALISSTVPTKANTGFTTWINQGTCVETDSAAGLSLYTATTSGTDNWQLLYKTAPASSYTATGLVTFTSNSGASGGPFGNAANCVGLGWYNVSTGALQVVCARWNTSNLWQMCVMNYSSPSAFSAYAKAATGAVIGYVWLQIQDDGTNVYFRYSQDGVNFVLMYSVAKSSGYLGSSGYGTPFFGINGNLASGTACSLGAVLMSYTD